MTTAFAHPTTSQEALDLLVAPPTDRVQGIAMTRFGQDPAHAPTVLLVHGLGSARTAWALVIPELCSSYHVISIDVPGHGDSDSVPEETSPAQLADRIHSAMQELGIERPHVMGNSLGGWISLEMAADERVASALALAPAGLWTGTNRTSKWLTVNRRLARFVGATVNPLMHIRAARYIALNSVCRYPGQLSKEMACEAMRGIRRSTSYELIHAGLDNNSFERAEQVPDSVPVTVLFGDKDVLLGPKVQNPDYVPAHTQWINVDRCGHLPMWDQPSAVLEAMDKTIASAAR